MSATAADKAFDVAIVGAGLAGSVAATMLARAGHAVAVIDPHASYPDEFRCEKLDSGQMAILKKTGLAEVVRSASTHDESAWVSRLGLLIEKRPSDQQGIDYGRLVNTVRAEIPRSVSFIRDKATEIANSPDLQRVTLASGESITARLVILASGLGNALRQSMGMDRVDLAPCFSVTIGFDVEPAPGARFPFRALTHYSEHARYRVSYITLFPIGKRMRANLFVYRDLRDPWLRAFRDDPEATLKAAAPRLERLTGPFRIVGPVKIRPIDLYETRGYRQPGVVLIGDAFATACPAAGTGARKALFDVERLCNGYVSEWLATPGMDAAKIARFYDDDAKRRSDARSLDLAMRTRSMALGTSPLWWMRRLAAIALGFSRWGLYAVRDAVRTLAPRSRAMTTSTGRPSEPAAPKSSRS
ncbi:FAD-dependent oxidoreductase [Hyphomicrobium sp.]|uniref:FAD-dependent oxidoreductase n=1 Tax=Hyphomicrobium sp. TaxID=82 RepID=UPI003F6FE53B